MPQFAQEKSIDRLSALMHPAQSGGPEDEGPTPAEGEMDSACPQTDRGTNRVRTEAALGEAGSIRHGKGRTLKEKADVLESRVQLLEADIEFYQEELAATQQALLALDCTNEDLRQRLLNLQAETERIREQARSSQETAGRSLTLMSVAVNALTRREDDAN